MKESQDAARAEMSAINERQRDFYDKPPARRGGGPINEALRAAREGLYRFNEEAGITRLACDRHRSWLGDLAGKRVLELGVGSGNRLSVEIASRCGYYLAMDLSPENIREFRATLDAAGLSQAEAKAMDFLSDAWPYEPFDVVYACSVLHHFRDFRVVLSLLHERVKAGGIVIGWDPLAASLLTRSLRALYRPFQDDADWEFPFSRKSFEAMSEYFEVVSVQGLLGISKWTVPLSMLPRTAARTKLIRRSIERDTRRANRLGGDFFSCLQATYCLRRRT